MKLAERNEIRLRVTRQHLRRTWLNWGVLPLVVCLVLTLAVDSVQAADFSMHSRQVEVNFQAVFAIAAMLFLVAFTVDGHWTNSRRLARRLADLVERDGRRAKADTRSEYAPVVFDTIESSIRALAVAGVAIAASALVVVGSGQGVYHALLILALAGAYQLFVLSRHPYYVQVMTLAAAGQLALEEDQQDS